MFFSEEADFFIIVDKTINWTRELIIMRQVWNTVWWKGQVKSRVGKIAG